MDKYLIALDLDGTLLHDWQTVSPKTKEYLINLQKQGHDIVIATGRPYRSSEKFYDELECKTPIINYNGGLVTSKHDENFPAYSITIDRSYIFEIMKHHHDKIENAFGEVKDDIYLLHDTDEIRPLLHYFNGATLTVGAFEETLKENTNGFILLAKEPFAEELEETLKDTYSDRVCVRNWGEVYNYIMELYTPETSKGNALKHVAEYLGYKQDHVIAIGDAHNDIEMLQYAGIGVAMKNAQDRLKKHADIVSEYTNQEDGIVHILEDLLK